MNHATPADANGIKAYRAYIREWISTVHRRSAGHLCISSPRSWAGCSFPTTEQGFDDATRYVTWLAAEGVPSIYLRMTTVDPAGRREEGHRGGANISQTLPCLWADLDIAGPGHKHHPNVPGTDGYDPTRTTTLPLPPDEDEAFQILIHAGLPAPTRMVHSGGGLYPIWQFTEPFDLSTPEGLTRGARVSEQLQDLIGWSASDQGWHYGTGVKDLARVLRIPGTINRKVTDAPVWCRVLPTEAGYDNGGNTLNFDGFAATVEEMCSAFGVNQARPEPPRPAPAPAGPIGEFTRNASTGGRHGQDEDTPLNRLEQSMTWAQILEPKGWTFDRTDHNGVSYWLRPGKHRGENHSATTGRDANRDRMWVFSDAAGLPTNESLTKPMVYALLWHGGDLSATAQEFADRRDAQADGIVLRPAPPQLDVDEQRRPEPAGQAPAAEQAPATPAEQPAGEWLPPRRMAAEKLPDFPVDQLPDVMRNMVLGVAGQMQVDPMLPAMYALGTLSAVGAPRFHVRRGRWMETINVYLMGALGAGERKSPTLRPFTRPLERIQDELEDVHRERLEQEIVDLRANSGVSGSVAEANRLEAQIAELEAQRDTPPQILLAPDSTPEALLSRLARNDGHGAIIDSEGGVAGGLSGRYSSGNPNLDVYLMPYDGDRLQVDRVSRGQVTVRRPNLTITCATQPSVVKDIARNQTLMERGLPARFMWFFPDHKAGKRNDMPSEHCPDEYLDAWSEMLQRIADFDIPGQRVRHEELPTLVMDPGAQRLHVEYGRKVEAAMADGCELERMRDWASKHAARAMRIAALLHLADGGDATREISELNMRRAIAIADWAVVHAKRFYLHMALGIDDDASNLECEELLKALRVRGVEKIGRRDLRRLVRANWMTGDKFNSILDVLLELGYLREFDYRDRSNRVRTGYLVNPHEPM